MRKFSGVVLRRISSGLYTFIHTDLPSSENEEILRRISQDNFLIFIHNSYDDVMCCHDEVCCHNDVITLSLSHTLRLYLDALACLNHSVVCVQPSHDP